jgi:hypothetical protein
MLSRLFQWAYYSATGDCWSQVQRDIGILPTLRWVVTGKEDDEARAFPPFHEAVLRGMREAENERAERAQGA